MLEKIKTAAKRIKSVITTTPLLKDEALSKCLGVSIYLKCENLQQTGSFKFRGAYNRLSALSKAERKNGVVAYSSGNHAQGVAKSASMLGIKATIVMPSDAPQMKIEATKGYGADVILFDRATTDRDVFVAGIHKERGGTFVHPFNDGYIIAGQGTLALEILKQVKEPLTHVLIPCSGGGLSGGVSTVFNALSPASKVYAVEPEGFDDMTRSLISGKQEKNMHKSGSICDGLLSPFPGDITLPINIKNGVTGLSVDEESVRKAVKYAYRQLKLVIEPSSAVGLALLLNGKFKPEGAVALVISGGNVDAKLFSEIIA